MKETVINISTFIELDPNAVFEIITDELESSLNKRGIILERGSSGKIIQNSIECGKIIEWKPGKNINIEWRQSSWQPDKVSTILISFEPAENGTNVLFEYNCLKNNLDIPEDIAGWFASELLANFINSISPDSFGDWLTDRRARRPFGEQSREFYRSPLYHYPNFKVILRELNLQPDDYLIEVGCGGGAFLKMALQSGCRAAAIDHSFDMVNLARKENKSAIADKRLEIHQSDAEILPFPDNTFSCAAMTGVLGFLKNPVQALLEIKRVLKKGGRAIIMGTDPEMKGTPAAPEPMVSRLHFYETEELEKLGHDAGFEKVKVERFGMEQYAKESGIPKEHLPLFTGPGSRFLIAKKII